MTYISVDCHCRRPIVSDIFVAVGALEIGAERRQREQQQQRFKLRIFNFLYQYVI